MADKKTTKKELDKEVQKKVETKKEATSEHEKIDNTLDMINESISDASSGRVVEKKAVNNDIDKNEMIQCVSITHGGLTWASPVTNAYYRWAEFGAYEDLTFSELQTMHNTNRDFLFHPRFIIQNARVVEFFRLQSTYENVAKIHDLEKVFSEGTLADIENVIDIVLKANMRDVVISKMRNMMHDGSLTNINIIKLLQDKLQFDLSDDTVE